MKAHHSETIPSSTAPYKPDMKALARDAHIEIIETNPVRTPNDAPLPMFPRRSSNIERPTAELILSEELRVVRHSIGYVSLQNFVIAKAYLLTANLPDTPAMPLDETRIDLLSPSSSLSQADNDKLEEAARELLMPKDSVATQIDHNPANQTPLSKRIIKDIAESFAVPPDQAALHLAELGYYIQLPKSAAS